MDFLTAILIATVVAALTPVVHQLTNRVVSDIRKRRAFDRLKAERLIAVGTVFGNIRDGSGGAPLFGLCEVVDLSVGRIAVRSLNVKGERGGFKMTWTGQEFETLHPLVMVNPTTGLPLDRHEMAALEQANAAKESVVPFPTGGTPSVN